MLRCGAGPGGLARVEAPAAVAGGVRVDLLGESGQRLHEGFQPAEVVFPCGRGWELGADFLNERQSGEAEAQLAGKRDLGHEILADDVGAPVAEHAGLGGGFTPGAINAEVDAARGHGQDVRQGPGQTGADSGGLAEAAGAFVFVECLGLMAREVDIVCDQEGVALGQDRIDCDNSIAGDDAADVKCLRGLERGPGVGARGEAVVGLNPDRRRAGAAAAGEGADGPVGGIDPAFFDERTDGLQRLGWKRDGQQKEQ